MIKIVDVLIGDASFITDEQLQERKLKRESDLHYLNSLIEQGYEIISSSPMTVGASGIMVYTLQIKNEDNPKI